MPRAVTPSSHPTRTELRNRWLRWSRERHTPQRQPTRGTPRLAPEPSTVMRVATFDDGATPVAAGDIAGEPSCGRRATQAGPPRSARSSASLASASARPFCSRGTWRALQWANRVSPFSASSQSGASLASRTRQRPCNCSTTNLLSRSRSISRAPSSAAKSIAATTARHSATLFVVVPIAAEIEAIGIASG